MGTAEELAAVLSQEVDVPVSYAENENVRIARRTLEESEIVYIRNTGTETNEITEPRLPSLL